MTEPIEAAPLAAWSHRVADVPERGLDVTRNATPAELAAIAAALDLVACERLQARYRLQALGGGRYLLEGELSAHVVQACVVSLEPVPGDVSETFEEEFWPPDQLPVAVNGLDGEQEALSVLIAEPIREGRLDAGRIVYEHLATALDPFPRKEGAELPPEVADAAPRAERDNPFAVLARLKKEP
jgi:uncharacterized metal-binding protein YceD (DUF177 family)